MRGCEGGSVEVWREDVDEHNGEGVRVRGWECGGRMWMSPMVRE